MKLNWLIVLASTVALTLGSCSKKNETTFTAADKSKTLNDFALIPEGSFTMGDHLDGDKGAPEHEVNVSAFYVARHEVTKALWDEVKVWGASHGYTDLSEGEGRALEHPVVVINWYDMVKWCNAKSEKEKLTPCFTVTGAIYKTGESDDVVCNLAANGYRLPNEAEWEKAARGGLKGKRFPWGDAISHSEANF